MTNIKIKNCFSKICSELKRKIFFLLKKAVKSNSSASKVFFIKYLGIWSFIDVFNRLRSYKRGVAQFGSAGALRAAEYLSQKHCKN